jgi:PLP dependent protein
LNALSNQGSSGLATRLERVRSRIRTAAARAGRPPDAVALLAVVKQVSDAEVAALLDLGVREIAENRVQRLLARPADLMARGRVHLIGSLQSNKVRKAMASAAEFHALDRFELVELLQKEAARTGKRWPVWIEVNVAREAQKHGCDPDDLPALVCAVVAAPQLLLRGLMAMAPLADDPELSRPHFRELARWSASLCAEKILPPSASGLSMGMSNDFEVAIEEGATVVRIGSAIFQDEGRDEDERAPHGAPDRAPAPKGP